jgi:hypothetical protein
MTIATLLNINDPNFAFDHDRLHRTMTAALPPGFTALLDLIQAATVPAGWWNTNHAQAHADFASAFPAINWPSKVAIADINLSTGPTEWWALSNRTLHNIADTMLPPNT